MDSSTVICWTSLVVILGVLGVFVSFIILFLFSMLMENPLANNFDPDHMPHYVASDLGLHCLCMTL